MGPLEGKAGRHLGGRRRALRGQDSSCDVEPLMAATSTTQNVGRTILGEPSGDSHRRSVISNLTSD
jgi:hypothetical protein